MGSAALHAASLLPSAGGTVSPPSAQLGRAQGLSEFPALGQAPRFTVGENTVPATTGQSARSGQRPNHKGRRAKAQAGTAQE